MLLRRFTDFVLQNQRNAILAALLCALVPIIGTVSIMIAALVTLRKGAVEGFLVFIAAIAPYVISYFLMTNASALATDMLDIFVLSSILTWLAAILLRQYSNWSLVLQAMALLAIVIILMVHLIVPDILHWWQEQFNGYLSSSAAMMGPLDSQTLTPENKAQIINAMSPYATGFFACGVIANALIQLLVTRWWQASLFNPGGLRKELHEIRLSALSGLALIIFLLLAYFQISAIIDIMPVIFLTFGVAGLSLLHYLAALNKFGWVWLAAIYIVLIVFLQYTILVVSMIAFCDIWFNFRNKLRTQTS